MPYSRRLGFLRDIAILAVTVVGGGEAHLPMFLHRLVRMRAYLSEEALLEMQALAQMIPGPTSTQILVALGYQRGGWSLALLTLWVWCLPASLLMASFAILAYYFSQFSFIMYFSMLLQPFAVALVLYALLILCPRIVRGKKAYAIVLVSAAIAFLWGKWYLFPLLLLCGGAFTAFSHKRLPTFPLLSFGFPLKGMAVWIGSFLLILGVAYRTDIPWIHLLKDFYRNGSLIFGGANALIPFLYADFVEYKQYLQPQEFLSGVALTQAIPGPFFALNAYVAALAMREYGWGMQILGALIGTIGAFMPGTLLVVLTYRFWNRLKGHHVIKAAMKGIHAVSIGLIAAACMTMLKALLPSFGSYIVLGGAFFLLYFAKISPLWLLLLLVIIAAGLSFYY